MIRRTTLPEGWTIAAFATDGKPDELWITVSALGMGDFTKLCTKDNERRMAQSRRAGTLRGRGVAPKYNDWDEAVSECNSTAREQSYRFVESIPKEVPRPMNSTDTHGAHPSPADQPKGGA